MGQDYGPVWQTHKRSANFAERRQRINEREQAAKQQREARIQSKSKNGLDKTSALQAELYEQGYAPEGMTFNQFVDGKDGKLTRDAMNRRKLAQKQVDYIINHNKETKGNVGQTALENVYKEAWVPTKDSDGMIRAEGLSAKECAKWANDVLRAYNDGKDYLGSVGGNAWTRNSSGTAQKVYSGFTGDVDKTKGDKIYKAYLALNSKASRTKQEEARYQQYIKQLQQLYQKDSIARNKTASDNLYKNFDSHTLDKNKTYLVNMGYTRSPNAGIAWMGSQDGTTGTHTGNLYWNPDTNSWRVAHNLNHNGIITDDDFISIQGGDNPKGYYVTDIAWLPTKKESLAARKKGNAKARDSWASEHYIKNALRGIVPSWQHEYESQIGTPIYDN